ncbi:hypothetical protein ACWD1Y_10825 [Streptomyces sp. NPDC002814]
MVRRIRRGAGHSGPADPAEPRHRGIEVTGNTWEHVTACSDLATLTRWLNRSITVTHAEELFAAEA